MTNEHSAGEQKAAFDDITKVSETIAFSGKHCQFSHYSHVNQCTMRFAIYLPPLANQSAKVPVIYWLSGLTCTDENFMQKAGALKIASKLGIAIVAPDTSPRGESVPDDPEQSYDFGLGAGYYLNAAKDPYQVNYNMYDYILDELLPLVERNFPVNKKKSISGHSMGGHGALVIGLKNPQLFESISAFSPICNPIECPWGQKAFTRYLGSDKSEWAEYDSCELIKKAKIHKPILIDQGTSDDFLEEQLKPENLIKNAMQADYKIQLNMHAGYDHSFYFISSFIDDHIAFHGQFLN